MNVNRSALKACVVYNMVDAKYYTYYGHQGDGGGNETGMTPKSGSISSLPSIATTSAGVANGSGRTGL